jgi:hypothetical protein
MIEKIKPDEMVVLRKNIDIVEALIYCINKVPGCVVRSIKSLQQSSVVLDITLNSRRDM